MIPSCAYSIARMSCFLNINYFKYLLRNMYYLRIQQRQFQWTDFDQANKSKFQTNTAFKTMHNSLFTGGTTQAS